GSRGEKTDDRDASAGSIPKPSAGCSSPARTGTRRIPRITFEAGAPLRVEGWVSEVEADHWSATTRTFSHIPRRDEAMTAVDDFIPLGGGDELSDDDAMARVGAPRSLSLGVPPFAGKRKAALLDEAMEDAEPASPHSDASSFDARKTPRLDGRTSPSPAATPPGGPIGTPPAEAALRARVAELEAALASIAAPQAHAGHVPHEHFARMEALHLVEIQRWQSRAAELEDRLARAGGAVDALRRENDELRRALGVHQAEAARRARHVREELEGVLARTKEPFQTLMDQYRKLSTMAEVLETEASGHHVEEL
ncbi:hypothetical protein DFJ74DRAFT_715946, partial [Hyaloraphidium curvatum]